MVKRRSKQIPNIKAIPWRVVNDTTLEIMCQIRNGNGMSTDISSDMDFTPQGIGYNLARMCERGLLKRNGTYGSSYTLTPLAEHMVEALKKFTGKEFKEIRMEDFNRHRRKDNPVTNVRKLTASFKVSMK